MRYFADFHASEPKRQNGSTKLLSHHWWQQLWFYFTLQYFFSKKLIKMAYTSIHNNSKRFILSSPMCHCKYPLSQHRYPISSYLRSRHIQQLQILVCRCNPGLPCTHFSENPMSLTVAELSHISAVFWLAPDRHWCLQILAINIDFILPVRYGTMNHKSFGWPWNTVSVWCFYFMRVALLATASVSCNFIQSRSQIKIHDSKTAACPILIG